MGNSCCSCCSSLQKPLTNQNPITTASELATADVRVMSQQELESLSRPPDAAALVRCLQRAFDDRDFSLPIRPMGTGESVLKKGTTYRPSMVGPSQPLVRSVQIGQNMKVLDRVGYAFAKYLRDDAAAVDPLAPFALWLLEDLYELYETPTRWRPGKLALIYQRNMNENPRLHRQLLGEEIIKLWQVLGDMLLREDTLLATCPTTDSFTEPTETTSSASGGSGSSATYSSSYSLAASAASNGATTGAAGNAEMERANPLPQSLWQVTSNLLRRVQTQLYSHLRQSSATVQFLTSDTCKDLWEKKQMAATLLMLGNNNGNLVG